MNIFFVRLLGGKTKIVVKIVQKSIQGSFSVCAKLSFGGDDRKRY